MKIDLKEISIRDLAAGYVDNDEDGVSGYDGKLDVRPPYQREFIYKDKQRDAVIDTVSKNFPLNVMYWAVREDGNFEVIDGQQRTISICQYIEGDFSVTLGNFEESRAFHNLQDNEKNKILDYKLMVYLCEGTDSEKLEWFKTINIAGEKLTDQELRNAVYHGTWVSDAKKYFSRSNCPAHGLGGNYLNGSAIRQDYLEKVIKWISRDGNIEQYMSDNQNKSNAEDLWDYFNKVIFWVKDIFPNYRKEMKLVDWGFHYNQCSKKNYNIEDIEATVSQLMEDDDVTNKKGIYDYIFTEKEKHLNIRAFSRNQKREAYEKQKGICTARNEYFEIDEMEADHIKPWHEGGKTDSLNCQMLCKSDNRQKSGK